MLEKENHPMEETKSYMFRTKDDRIVIFGVNYSFKEHVETESNLFLKLKP